MTLTSSSRAAVPSRTSFARRQRGARAALARLGKGEEDRARGLRNPARARHRADRPGRARHLRDAGHGFGQAFPSTRSRMRPARSVTIALAIGQEIQAPGFLQPVGDDFGLEPERSVSKRLSFGRRRLRGDVTTAQTRRAEIAWLEILAFPYLRTMAIMSRNDKRFAAVGCITAVTIGSTGRVMARRPGSIRLAGTAIFVRENRAKWCYIGANQVKRVR